MNGYEVNAQKNGTEAKTDTHRTTALLETGLVDEVVLFDEDTPAAVILGVKPAYFMKGPDYMGMTLPEADALKACGAGLIICRGSKIGNSSDIT